MNSVISREYVEKNYIHKDIIRNILEKYKHTEVTDEDNILNFYQEIRQTLEDK